MDTSQLHIHNLKAIHSKRFHSVLLVLVLSSLFFFYDYAPHRDLHSFPTRRSSDLVQHDRTADDVDRRGDDELGILAEKKGQDRKSTRLNSSHPSISYAVFCLKKKLSTARQDHHRSQSLYCRQAA